MKINKEITDAFEAALTAGITEKAIERYNKDVRDLSDRIAGDLEWMLRDELAPRMVEQTVMMAERAVEAMLAGNESEMRRWLSCDKRGPDGEYIGWTGRTDGYTAANRDLHPVIHGKLFETGALELRKQVASANEALLRDERIRDLEDQVKSLVAQVNKANAEREAMWERLRNAA